MYAQVFKFFSKFDCSSALKTSPLFSSQTFMDKFSESLQIEYGDKGIIVQVKNP